MAKAKYNFSNIHRQEERFYIPVLKIEVTGKVRFIFLIFSSLIVGALSFSILSNLFGFNIGFVLTGVFTLGFARVVLSNLNNQDEDGKMPLEKWYLRKINGRVIYDQHNQEIIVEKKYKTRGVRMYGLHRKYRARGK